MIKDNTKYIHKVISFRTKRNRIVFGFSNKPIGPGYILGDTYYGLPTIYLGVLAIQIPIIVNKRIITAGKYTFKFLKQRWAGDMKNNSFVSIGINNNNYLFYNNTKMIDTENKLEELLNKLIDLGWKPFGIDYENFVESYYDGPIYAFNHKDGYGTDCSLNDLCSIDSGLWQFVVEKELYETNNGDYVVEDERYGIIQDQKDIEHLLMMSAIQEDKISFILNNIVLDSKGIE